MPAIVSGTKAPDFKLPGTDGQSYSLSETLSKNLAVVVFYKNTCPTCQFIMPFVERIHRAYKDKGLSTLGIEQDSKEEGIAFSKQYGLTFTVLTDPENYKTSYAYGVDTVPSIFLIDKNGEIFFTSVGFVKDELTELSGKIAQKLGTQVIEVYKPGEYVPAFKAG